MSAARFYSEELVKLLGQKVILTEDGEQRAKGVIEGCRYKGMENKEQYYVFRIMGERPWESTYGLESFANKFVVISLASQSNEAEM